MMRTNSSSPFLFCILLLLLLLNSSLSSTHADPHHQNSAMDFLKPMVGTQRGNSTPGISKLKKHLSNLGYIDNINNVNLESSAPPHNDLFDETLETAVRKYQSFFKLTPTGMLDAATLAHMRKPRCGVPDIFHNHHNTSAKYNFFPGTPKWPEGKRVLYYSFLPGTRKDLINAIHDATNIWAGVSPLKFAYMLDFDRADIKITFEYRDHGDGVPFDGRGGILAHAFAPTDGRLHFDGDELWVDGVLAEEFDMQTVGLHELGHILGLQHSSDGGSIMFPSIGNGFRKGLGQDDINGIRALYPS